MSTATYSLDLTSLSDEAFNEIVNADVRGTADEQTSLALRDPMVVDRWYDTLASLKRSVEAQLTANRGEQAAKQAEFLRMGPSGKAMWLQSRAAAEKWRQGAIRFKNGVEDRMAEARRLRSHLDQNSYVRILARERDNAVKETMRLRSAIVKHRAAVELDQDEQDDIDERLWAVVEGNLDL